jgi:hypothetical protein
MSQVENYRQQVQGSLQDEHDRKFELHQTTWNAKFSRRTGETMEMPELRRNDLLP